MQNAAARLITPSRKCDHITPILLDLPTSYLSANELNSRFYYLPSKLCISNLQPTFKTLSSATFRSSSTPSMNPVSFNLKTYGSRAFSVSAPELWNKLPDDIRSCENLSLFNTYLFKNFYFSH